MKPDWKDAPAAAKWMAMDEDGTWEWYSSEPVCYEPESGDMSGYGFWAGPQGKTLGKAGFSDDNEGWGDSAEPRP